MGFIMVLWYLSAVTCAVVCSGDAPRPHIVYILADDLGWNDVGFHGSNQIPTPNVDALAYSGRPLQRYYVPPVCTPSRAALHTGKYPIHTGMQHGVIYGAEPRGLPLTEKLLPQYLRELGYRTHLVGKWHLGSYKRAYLPLSRGFESHLGFWTGRVDYYDHTSMEHGSWGFDFRRGWAVAHDLFGEYVTDVLTSEAVRVINGHNASEPLFLLLAHGAVHSGNPYTPLRAPDKLVDTFSHIQDPDRRKFAAMLTKLDESVGRVVEALHQRGLLQRSLLVFSSDNGGPAASFNLNAASNYPLRGVKNTLWEGGVRVAALLWSPLLAKEARSQVASQLMHAVDWLPTLYSAAGGNASKLEDIDGIDQWGALSLDTPTARTRLLHNIDDLIGNAALTDWPWKVHSGSNYNGNWDSWYGPSGRTDSYDMDAVYNSLAGKALSSLGLMPNRNVSSGLRERSTVQCAEEHTTCRPLKAPCLFNVDLDPCEKNNMADQEPTVLEEMLSLLQQYRSTASEPNNKPLDPRGDPALWGRVYTNFGDYY